MWVLKITKFSLVLRGGVGMVEVDGTCVRYVSTREVVVQGVVERGGERMVRSLVNP